MGFERYEGVHGKQNLAKVCAAIEACGATVMNVPDPGVAPYEITIRTPGGELVDLVCYAFTANEYMQRGRPAGEHRFQIKYGSEFDRYHEIYVDERRRRITLMFGVHHELDLFVCVDPDMHNPTRFSASVEFKKEQLEVAVRTGWHGWERERATGRRQQEMPLSNLRTEALGAFASTNFLRYVAFERIATSLDTGERMLLWEQAGRGALDGGTPRVVTHIGHPLELMLALPAAEILDVVQEHFRLLVALRGGVAEHHLGRLLRATDGVTRVEALDLDGHADFRVSFEGKDVLIECKNTLRTMTANGLPRVDFQKTRASKDDPCSRYYSPAQFHVLAACLHPITEVWQYAFRETSALQRHPKCQGRLASNVTVDREWRSQPTEVLRCVTSEL